VREGAPNDLFLVLVRNVQSDLTALHLAAKVGNAECIQLLLANGADVNSKARVHTELQTDGFRCIFLPVDVFTYSLTFVSFRFATCHHP